MADASWSLIAAAAAGLAVLVWRAPPGARLGVAGVTGRPPAPAVRRRVQQSALVALSAVPSAIGLGWWALPVAAVLGVVSYVVLGRLVAAAVAHRRDQLVAALPQACDLMAVCLESGLPLRLAATEVAGVLSEPLGGVLAEVSATVALGADEPEAWAQLALDEPALAALGREVARTLGSGVALAASLRILGVDARRQGVAAALVRARRVGVRSVLPLMTCFLPSFLLLGVVPIIGGVVGHLLG
ncbi:MAG: type II secretion system F family protein [Propionicimonas sp.]